MNIKKMTALLFLSFLLSSCTEDAGSDGGLFDPKIPGGTINTSTIKSLQTLNIAVTNSDVTISFSIPTEYAGLSNSVKIYKRGCFHESDSCILPNPTQPYTSAELYKVFESDSLLSWKDVDVLPQTNYTYWVYLVVDERWNAGQKLHAFTEETGFNITVPTGESFWSKKAWEYGSPSIGGITNVNSIAEVSHIYERKNPLVDVAEPLVFKAGGVAYGKSGNVLYVSDTANNRVVIYAKREALACGENDGSMEYYACIFSYQGFPFSPINILGQRNQSETGPCKTNLQCSTNLDELSCNSDSCAWEAASCVPRLPMSQCLTNPTSLHVDGDTLLISDSGNNRVVVHSVAPFDTGCDPNIFFGQTSVVNCEPSFVIGQRTKDAVTIETVQSGGNRRLNQPQGLKTKDGDLYIADTRNHRVVKLRNYKNYACGGIDTSLWDLDNAQCNFSSVLGQETFFKRDNLFDDLRDGVVIVNPTGLGNNINDLSYNKRRFSNPIDVDFDSSDNLIISTYSGIYMPNGSNINEIRSRILVYDGNPIGAASPTCNATTFWSGACDSNNIIGQSAPQSFAVYSSSGNYSDVSFGLNFAAGLTSIGENIFATDSSGLVYIWKSYKDILVSGVPPTTKVSNTVGLMEAGSITFSKDTLRMIIQDSKDSKLHEIRLD